MKSTIALLLVLFLAGLGSAALSPMEAVRETIQKMRQAVKDPSLRGDKQRDRREQIIRDLILERMDFEEMAKRSLGRHWRSLSSEERQEFVELFSQYLEVFYKKQVLSTIEQVADVDVIYVKERPDGEFAEVETIVVAGRDRYAVAYKLHFINDRWKVYDIVVEGISTVNNWRVQFDRVITRYSYAELVKRIKAVIAENHSAYFFPFNHLARLWLVALLYRK